MTHKCAATNCQRQVPLNMLMCSGHWRQLPGRMRNTIWNEYRPGQENDLHLVTPAYKAAVKEAVDFLWEKAASK